MSKSLLYKRIDDLVARHGSYRAAARVLQTDHAYLHRIRQGKKDAGGHTLKRLKLRKIVNYESIGQRRESDPCPCCGK